VSGLDHARLRPPRAEADLLARTTLTDSAHVAAAPVLLIEADAGYGKTTVADQLTVAGPRIWYALSSADRDPLVFLAHLQAGLAAALPGLTVSAGRGATERSPTWPDLVDSILDAIVAQPSSLHMIFDDYHLVAESQVDQAVGRLIERLPEQLQLIIVSRREIGSSHWIKARASGRIHCVGRAELAFNPAEVRQLFRVSFGLELSEVHAQLLAEETEGWPIGLHMLGQQAVERELEPEALLGELPDNRAAVFTYLGDQVLRTVPPHIRSFLLQCSCLEVLGADVCADTCRSTPQDARAVLNEIGKSGVFCADIGGGLFRLHHVFREYLRSQLNESQIRDIEQRAAAHFRGTGEFESAARHSLRALQYEDAAADIALINDSLIASGRALTLLALTDGLPQDVLARHPSLLIARSTALRLTSRYPKALIEATRAANLLSASGDAGGRFAALTSQAMIYLDTVQPAAAAPILYSAGLLSRELTDIQRNAWRALVAENLVNEGRLSRAERRHRALSADPSPGTRASAIRLLVRQGDLHRACAALESRPSPDSNRIPHAHREDAALLSWIYALLGKSAAAEEHARHGAELGQRLSSPILECLCTGRLGIAMLCRAEPDALPAAEKAFQEALSVATSIQVPRFRAEPLIGLTIHAGRIGEFGNAMEFGHDAIQTLTAAGDHYLAAMATLAVGVAGAHQQHPSAAGWLHDAAGIAQRCGDAYMPLIAYIWLGHIALTADDTFAHHARAAITTTARLALDDVWIRSSWLGLTSLEDRVRWLQAARGVPGAQKYSDYLLARIAPSAPRSLHPSTDVKAPVLQITTLGRFSVYRGGIPIAETQWARRKAMEILWLLCSRTTHAIAREEAIDILWPDGDADASNAKFRVSLHALRHVLEPARSPRAPGELVGATAERIHLKPAIQIDIDEFSALTDLATAGTGEDSLTAALKAIDLYHGPFIAEAPYTDWLRPTRDACQATFIQLCDSTARTHLEQGQYSTAAALARRIIDEDPYRESAYRIIAEAHTHAGDPAAARRAYSDCRRRLYDELGIEPSWSL